MIKLLPKQFNILFCGFHAKNYQKPAKIDGNSGKHLATALWDLLLASPEEWSLWEKPSEGLSKLHHKKVQRSLLATSLQFFCKTSPTLSRDILATSNGILRFGRRNCIFRVPKNISGKNCFWRKACFCFLFYFSYFLLKNFQGILFFFWVFSKNFLRGWQTCVFFGWKNVSTATKLQRGLEFVFKPGRKPFGKVNETAFFGSRATFWKNPLLLIKRSL